MASAAARRRAAGQRPGGYRGAVPLEPCLPEGPSRDLRLRQGRGPERAVKALVAATVLTDRQMIQNRSGRSHNLSLWINPVAFGDTARPSQPETESGTRATL